MQAALPDECLRITRTAPHPSLDDRNGHLKKKLAAQGQLGYHADTDDEADDSETMDDAQDLHPSAHHRSGGGGPHHSHHHHSHGYGGHHHAEVTSQQHYRAPTAGVKRLVDGRRREPSYERQQQQPREPPYAPAPEASARPPSGLPISEWPGRAGLLRLGRLLRWGGGTASRHQSRSATWGHRGYADKAVWLHGWTFVDLISICGP